MTRYKVIAPQGGTLLSAGDAIVSSMHRAGRQGVRSPGSTRAVGGRLAASGRNGFLVEGQVLTEDGTVLPAHVTDGAPSGDLSSSGSSLGGHPVLARPGDRAPRPDPGGGTHFWIRLQRDGVIAPTREDRLLVMRSMLTIGEPFLLVAASCADTHGHGLTLLDEARTRELARRIECSLSRKLHLPVGFAPVQTRPIESIWHRYRSFDYVHDQGRHHGLDWDQAFEATNLPDLLGLRLIGAYARDLVARYLPRVRPRDLVKRLGIGVLSQADGPIEWLLEAAGAAIGRPGLKGSSYEVREARRAALEIAGARLKTVEVARILDISRATVARLRDRPASPELVRAVRLQLGLRTQLAAARRDDG